MIRVLVLILAMLGFFWLFAANYSALDGGNAIPVAIGFWGFCLSPIVFSLVIFADVIQWIKRRWGSK